MAAEFIFIGGFLTVFLVATKNTWNESRCTKAWFHDWKRDTTVAETKHDYTVGSHVYTSTCGTFSCLHCLERREIEIDTTEPPSDYGYD